MSLVAGLLIAVGGAPPQERAAPPTLSVTTDLVTLSVMVVDRQEVPAAGLRQEHFTVYDNGDRQPIQFFSSDEQPATIGLLIDASASMRGRRGDVLSAGEAFAAIRHPLDEFFTLNFNEAVWPGLPPSVDFTDDVDRLRAALFAAPAQGMTALYDALDRGLSHLQRGTRDRKALILVSDGGDNASRKTLTSVLEHARRTNAVIYSVTFFDPDNPDARPGVLKRLARETGGRAVTPGPTDDVRAAFAQIARDIRSGYTIGFAPAETSKGGFRTIRVVVDDGQRRPLIARTRAGYYAEPSPTRGR
jgi:Ca-activated chloride channel family protein